MSFKKSIFLTLLFSNLALVASAQIAKDVFPLSREFKNGGYYISPLATVSFGNKVMGNFNREEGGIYNYETIGRGKWGYGLEGGWYQTFEKSWIPDYVEGGLSYRKFSAASEHTGTFTNGATVLNFESDNNVDIQMVTAVARVIDAIHFEERHHFFSYGLGINYNYKFSEKIKRSRSYLDSYEEFLGVHSLQLHLQVGYGFQFNKNVVMIATAETPLVTAYPSGNLNPAFPFFSARYHPLIIGLKIMRLRKDPVNCNTPTLQGVPGTN